MHYLLQKIAKWSLHIIIGLAIVFNLLKVEAIYFIYVLNVFFLLAIYTLLRSRQNFKRVEREFGKIRLNFANVTPINSMIDAVLECGYKLSEIEKVSLVSSDLQASCKYLKDSKAIEILKENNPSMYLEIVGVGNINNNLETSCSDVSIYTMNTQNNEHKNLITMKNGKHFLWYESNHKRINNKDVFTDGVYFVELTDEKAQQLAREYEDLKAA